MVDTSEIRKSLEQACQQLLSKKISSVELKKQLTPFINQLFKTYKKRNIIKDASYEYKSSWKVLYPNVFKRLIAYILLKTKIYKHLNNKSVKWYHKILPYTIKELHMYRTGLLNMFINQQYIKAGVIPNILLDLDLEMSKEDIYNWADNHDIKFDYINEWIDLQLPKVIKTPILKDPREYVFMNIKIDADAEYIFYLSTKISIDD